MSLQWTAVATFLYVEVFLVLLLCIPFISPRRSEHTRAALSCFSSLLFVNEHTRTYSSVRKRLALCEYDFQSGLINPANFHLSRSGQ